MTGNQWWPGDRWDMQRQVRGVNEKQKNLRKIWGVMDMLIILIVVMLLHENL